jgi:hypothetical protein
VLKSNLNYHHLANKYANIFSTRQYGKLYKEKYPDDLSNLLKATQKAKENLSKMKDL